MGSATREALASSTKALEALGAVGLETAVGLFEAGRVVGDSAQLRALIADPAADPDGKTAVVERVFGAQLDPSALTVLTAVARERWSNHDELLAGIEELGLRAAARSAKPAAIDAELLSFARAVASDADLELAIGSKLGQTSSKVSLVEKLLSGKATGQTLEIVKHLVQQPRDRRIGELLRNAARIVADELGYTVATVTSASPISDAQLKRLEQTLAATYGRALRISQVTDPQLVGGLRVQVADDVFDGSIQSRLAELKLQLAG
ncbi:F0F1 ATP synthase subunit delta [Okibacterium endophyticum]